VVPIHLNQDWNLINRAVIPVVWKPGSVAVPERAAGLRAYGLFGVPLAQKPGRRLDGGRWPDRPTPDGDQPDRRF
jgi:hypothetical protein